MNVGIVIVQLVEQLLVDFTNKHLALAGRHLEVLNEVLSEQLWRTQVIVKVPGEGVAHFQLVDLKIQSHGYELFQIFGFLSGIFLEMRSSRVLLLPTLRHVAGYSRRVLSSVRPLQ